MYLNPKLCRFLADSPTMNAARGPLLPWGRQCTACRDCVQLLARPSLNDPEFHVLFPLFPNHILALRFRRHHRGPDEEQLASRRPPSRSLSSHSSVLFLLLLLLTLSFSSDFPFLFWRETVLHPLLFAHCFRPWSSPPGPSPPKPSPASPTSSPVDDLPPLSSWPAPPTPPTTKDKDGSERSCSACSSSLEPPLHRRSSL